MNSSSGNAQGSGESVRTLTASAISELVGGELHGDGSTVVEAVAPLDRATIKNVSFLGGARYAGLASASKAGIVLVTRGLEDAVSAIPARIIVDKPSEAILALLPALYPESIRTPGIHPTAVIRRGARLGKGVVVDEYAIVGENAQIGEGVRIGSHCVVGDGVSVGSHSMLHPHVTLCPGSKLGERVSVHSGSRIGNDGFGYLQRGGVHEKIRHVGRCIIGNDVEIGANSTIDRGSVDDTVIGAGTKIDNLVQIGHNCRIGNLCLIMAQVGISGSVRIEDGCIIAGQAGLGGHITIGTGARIGGQAGVFGDVPAGESWSGYPARPHKESLRTTGALFKLAGMLKRIEKLLEDKERA